MGHTARGVGHIGVGDVLKQVVKGSNAFAGAPRSLILSSYTMTVIANRGRSLIYKLTIALLIFYEVLNKVSIVGLRLSRGSMLK